MAKKRVRKCVCGVAAASQVALLVPEESTSTFSVQVYSRKVWLCATCRYKIASMNYDFMAKAKRIRIEEAGLTRRQIQVLQIFAFHRSSRGVMPTYREVADELDVNVNAVKGHVDALVDKGFMERGPRDHARSLKILVEV